MPKLTRLELKGFKSIQEMDLELRALNVLIGANGSGKSNLISFFKLLNEMMAGRLANHVGESGGASSLLYYGPRVTPQLEARLKFEADNGTNSYSMRLAFSEPDRLTFSEESLTFHRTGEPPPTSSLLLRTGDLETGVLQAAASGNQTAVAFRHLLNNCRVYHFHDTSRVARVRLACGVRDHRWLMPDGGNLAAMLSRLREENEAAYRPIVSTIRLVVPFFDDFDLEPVGDDKLMLDWRARGSDRVFGPHQLSDGTLRAMCLITLLMWPGELPYLIIVDEPELGLHPYALNVVASLFQKASHRHQILISTQSSSFLSNFDPEDVIVVDRRNNASQFSRPAPEKLAAWLEDYSLGEVWEKNVIAGGP